MTFASLQLSEPLLRAIDELNYAAPTPIQSAAIPAILRGDDMRACAQTGSGKTAAFALPILQLVLQCREAGQRRETGDHAQALIQALILAPTRELAMQIGDVFRAFARYAPSKLRIATVFGGVSINPQMMALRGGADIVIATPGRLLDLVDNNALRLNAIRTLVLDEADKLFELGFSDELTRILMLLPPRQTLLFSATFPPSVRILADVVLNNPTCIDISPTAAVEPAIRHRAIAVEPPRRVQLLRHLIESNAWSRVLVFVATQYATEHVAEKLRRGGIAAAALHGELSQGARTQSLADFKSSKVQVLVATDVAARGIDIAQLPVVVNFDLPRSAVDYTHRVGRTGRAGETGIAVSFVSAETEAHFRLIEKRNRISAPREQVPGFETSLDKPTVASNPVSGAKAGAAPEGTGGVKGKRKSKKDKLREAARSGANKD